MDALTTYAFPPGLVAGLTDVPNMQNIKDVTKSVISLSGWWGSMYAFIAGLSGTLGAGAALNTDSSTMRFWANLMTVVGMFYLYTIVSKRRKKARLSDAEEQHVEFGRLLRAKIGKRKSAGKNKKTYSFGKRTTATKKGRRQSTTRRASSFGGRKGKTTKKKTDRRRK